MDPDRWRRLTELFHQALELDPEHRQAFLATACGDDGALRSEVESLLAYHDHADQMLDGSPALQLSASQNADTSLVGARLQHYHVTRRLGAGGMGVVYLADDTRLGRPVAIKVLARQFTQDARRRERLRREARLAAGLSHPAIATIYALEEADDRLFIVSEYVEGATLRDEVSTRPLSVAALLDTGIEIVQALAAAHARGIVHRDLKPDNVIRTADGSVKVLDFGLAQLADAGRQDTPSDERLTEPGVSLGTPGYMPPEQLRGASVDARADIFALGVTLFELLSGVHPFASSNVVSTMARVLESEPPNLAHLEPTCPHRLQAVITRCLEKDPARRYGSADELLGALETVRTEAGGIASGAADEGVPLDIERPAARGPGRATPLWWWQFHQVGMSLGYCAMLIPLWNVRGWVPAPWGAALVFGAVAVVGGAATLRLHLWFTSRFYPAELPRQRSQVGNWIRLSDWLFVIVLLVAGGSAALEHAGFAALCLAVAIATLVARTVVEPATTRAAFK